MPLRESPSTDVADDGAPCPRAAATTPTPGTPPTPCRRKSVGSRPSGPPECPGRTPTRDCWSTHRECRCAAVPGGSCRIHRGATGGRLSVQPDMLAIRVFLVDAHEVTRRGVTTVLAADPHIRVVGEAESMDQARRRARRCGRTSRSSNGAPLCADLRLVLPGMRCPALGRTSIPRRRPPPFGPARPDTSSRTRTARNSWPRCAAWPPARSCSPTATMALSEPSAQTVTTKNRVALRTATGAPAAAAARGRSQQPRDRRAPRPGGQDGEELRKHPAGEAEPNQSHPGGGPRHSSCAPAVGPPVPDGPAHRHVSAARCPDPEAPASLAFDVPSSGSSSSSSSLGVGSRAMCDIPSVLVLVHDLHIRAQHQRTTTQRPHPGPDQELPATGPTVNAVCPRGDLNPHAR